jgi:hypothetical protein
MHSCITRLIKPSRLLLLPQSTSPVKLCNTRQPMQLPVTTAMLQASS